MEDDSPLENWLMTVYRNAYLALRVFPNILAFSERISSPKRISLADGKD
jgi:hypothetical protein